MRTRCPFIALLAVPAALLCLLASPASAPAERARLRAHQIVSETVTISDVEAEIQFGRGVAARILGTYPLYRDSRLAKYVNLVGHALATHTNRTELRYHFAVLNTDVANAYAAPGGYVFVTRGALELTRSEAEIAGILAHEIGHITRRHIVKELGIQGSSTEITAGLASLLGGAGASTRLAFSQAVDSAVTILLADGYKAADELEADRTAVAVLSNTGYDAAALARYLERIHSLRRDAGEVEKHSYPTSEERLVRLRGSLSGIEAPWPTHAALQERFEQNVQLP
jgi:predicted Zn-dependent protease